MSPHVLITGAAGYIGGSILAALAQSDGPVPKGNVYATVRGQDQQESLSKLGINVIRLDLNDENALVEAVAHNEIDILINTAVSFVPSMVLAMIKALGERRKATGAAVHFIHSGVITVFAAEAGWPYGEVKDTDLVYQMEKDWIMSHPVRETDVLVIEASKAHGVTCVNMGIPCVYGRGTGHGRQLSVLIPALVRTSIAEKAVYRFDKDSNPPATHISDLVELYVLLLKNVVGKEPMPSGEQGYYFAMAHRAPWWHVMDRIAGSLFARGLVSRPEIQIWPSDGMAAEKLGFPVEYVRAMGTASGEQVAVNAFQLGWTPNWNQERFLASIDDEVQAVIDLDNGKSSLFKPLIDTDRS